MAESGSIELFVPGRICLFGEHSDWAGGYRRFNSEISEGCALVCGTSQGLYARARKLKGQRVLSFKGSDGTACELPLEDTAHLRQVANSASYFAYIAGTMLEFSKHFRVEGAEITNYKTDLPIRKGLSSSAAICVLIVRALNQLYDLKLTVHGEMDIAYRGEINTPSRCGRLDQCVAFGQTVTRMSFDSDVIDTQPVRVAASLYLVIVDLRAAKDTKEILKCLNAAYPFPKTDADRALHSLLGSVNLDACARAAEVISKEKDSLAAAEKLGALMTEAQARWDACAVPLCPHELKAPTLHKLLDCPTLKPFVTGGKGVGSQGDGSAQLVCRDEASQTEAMKIVQGLGMEPLRLTIPKAKAVRRAVVPVAGTCPGMWPSTKAVGAWLFPVRVGEAVKPAICWLCEDLIAAGIEQIILVVNGTTEEDMRRLFMKREDAAVLNGVASKVAAYDEELLQIGKRLEFVRQDSPSGLKDAVLLCERAVDGEPFVLAFGDHICSSTSPDGRGCVAQMLQSCDGTHSIAAMHCLEQGHLHTTGVFSSKKPPAPLPPPLGPRLVRAAGADAPAPPLWPISRLAEKPTREYAVEHLQTPGLAEGHFLASFGQYVLTSTVFEVARSSEQRHLMECLDVLRQREGLSGVLIEGVRWDLGNISTYVEALQQQASVPAAKRQRTDR